MEIERNPAIFTNEPLPTLAPSANVEAAAEAPVKTLIQMDGDEHKTQRGIVNDWFKPGNVKRMQDRVDELAKVYVDRMAAMGGR
jgi:cytochrome P450